MGTIIKTARDMKECSISPETRQMVLQQLRNLAHQLEDCETVICSACQRDAKQSPQANTSARQQEPTKYVVQTIQKTPPWERPRYPSIELTSGDLVQGCDCSRRNGLQDRCERQECRGQPQCLTKPNPTCPPSGGGGVGGKEQQQTNDVLCFGCRQEQTKAGAKAAIQKPCGHCVQNVAGLTSDVMGGHIAFLVTPLKPVTVKTPDTKQLV